ncbi:MAG: hypothetical protein MJK15_04145 [Colwellia sp.]|nr:hypothetical protein [Colwellia sp.]
MLTACSLSDASHTTSGKVYAATQVADITILLDTPEQEFIVIALVDSNGVGFTKNKSKDRAMTALKKEAASIGAHAIILTSSNTGIAQGFDGEPAGQESILSGKAIRLIPSDLKTDK